MTTRDFLSAVIAANINDDVTTTATAELAKLDARNEKRRNTPTKTQEANVAVKEAIRAFLATAPKSLASSIAAACGVSTQKVSALCGQMVTANEITVTDTKIKGKGTLKAYSLAE